MEHTACTTDLSASPPSNGRSLESDATRRKRGAGATTRTLGGRYRVRKLVGVGGSASVYAGVDVGMERPVAIKIPNTSAFPDARRRLRREARMAASILHPGVCPLFDVGACDDGTPYLVMPLLIGCTLRKALARDRRVFPLDAVDVVVQLLSALDAVHACGIVHRDVKPENLFLVTRSNCTPVVSLIDFGAALAASDVPDPERLTHAGMVVGTPEYMAPEQAMGIRCVDARVDVWGAGLVLYEALTGLRPFAGIDVDTSLTAILEREVLPPSCFVPELPKELDSVVMRALAKDPGARYASAAAFQRDLVAVAAAVGARPADVRPAPAPSAPPPASTGSYPAYAARVPTRRLARG